MKLYILYGSESILSNHLLILLARTLFVYVYLITKFPQKENFIDIKFNDQTFKILSEHLTHLIPES